MTILLRSAIEIYEKRYILERLISQYVTLRYRRTLFGYLWTILNPLMMMSVMALVFSSLFKAELEGFAIFLFAGMIPWNFFNAVITQSGSTLIMNEGLIKKIYLPKTIFVLSVAVALLIDSILSFLALFLIILAIGGKFSLSIFFIPVAFLLLFFFSLGTAFIVSIATVFFRDLQYIIGIVMQGLFFLTPILYKGDSLSGLTKSLVSLNPIVPFIDLFRAPICYSSWPSGILVLQAAGLAIASLFFGLALFLQHQNKIVFRL